MSLVALIEDLNRLQRLGDDWYGYEERWDHGDGTTSIIGHHCSQRGYEQIGRLAAIHRQHAEAIAAWMDIYGLTQCAHGRPLNDLAWDTNDYCFDVWDEADRAVFILNGWHEVNGDPLAVFCLPWWYEAIGATSGFFYRGGDAR